MEPLSLEELLALSIDEPLAEADQQRLDQALADSAELRALQADLQQLRELAQQPLALEAPAMGPLLGQVERQFPRKKRMPQPAYLALAAAVLIFFLIRPGTVEPGPSTSIDPQLQLDEQRNFYHLAMGPAENLAVQHLARLDPRLAGSFGQRIHNVNEMLIYCERVAKQNPTHPESLKALSQIYQAKEDLLLLILET